MLRVHCGTRHLERRFDVSRIDRVRRTSSLVGWSSFIAAGQRLGVSAGGGSAVTERGALIPSRYHTLHAGTLRGLFLAHWSTPWTLRRLNSECRSVTTPAFRAVISPSGPSESLETRYDWPESSYVEQGALLKQRSCVFISHCKDRICGRNSVVECQLPKLIRGISKYLPHLVLPSVLSGLSDWFGDCSETGFWPVSTLDLAQIWHKIRTHTRRT
jgi:hypothetical protein